MKIKINKLSEKKYFADIDSKDTLLTIKATSFNKLMTKKKKMNIKLTQKDKGMLLTKGEITK